jgi:hypothetical protein
MGMAVRVHLPQVHRSGSKVCFQRREAHFFQYRRKERAKAIAGAVRRKIQSCKAAIREAGHPVKGQRGAGKAVGVRAPVRSHRSYRQSTTAPGR